ncbi:flagellar protein FlhE [Lonsdalea quercina]|uniref:flagellar protein FlhE n=1 Tax=Lonsdalea quercina TaxID=71657 RepID=UPI003974E255
MKSTKCFSILVKTIACALMLGSLQAYADNGYYSEVSAKDIYSPNFWNVTNFTIPSSVKFPSNARLNDVRWKYTISGRIPTQGTFIAMLCHGDNSTCLDVTHEQVGTTTAFNYDGKNPATVPFYLMYRVNSRSSFSPISTGNAQVIVNMTN